MARTTRSACCRRPGFMRPRPIACSNAPCDPSGYSSSRPAGGSCGRTSCYLPDYDITFSGAAELWSRRRRGQGFHDCNALAGSPPDDTVFLGGKDYLPLFLALTRDVSGRRLVLHNSTVEPSAPGCRVQRFDTPRRTNWHYDCAAALASGRLGLA